MKRNLQIILTATTASFLTFPVLAENNTTSQSGSPDYTQGNSSHYQGANRLQGAAKASDLMGMDVHNRQNEKLGTVDDLWVDLQSGRVVLVNISSGGFIGIGESSRALPPSALKLDTSNKVLLLDADKAKMDGSPEFDAGISAESASSSNVAAIYRHYGKADDFNFIDQNQSRRDGQRNQQNATNQMNDSGNTMTRNNDQTWDRSNSLYEREGMMSSDRLGSLQRASDLIGMDVENGQDETLGEVENLVVDLASGRIVTVVVSTGEFLGMGGELSAVPPTALQFRGDWSELQLDTTKEKLSSAPHFKADQWPDFSQQDQASDVYRAYQREPYFADNTRTDMDNIIWTDTNNALTDADNTERNRYDRNDRALNAMDQGESMADIETTASIRREITANDTMSVNAQNVKIITNNGQVTLRGPVDSAEEKQLIGEIANRIAQSANVDNQLEINTDNESGDQFTTVSN